MKYEPINRRILLRKFNEEKDKPREDGLVFPESKKTAILHSDIWVVESWADDVERFSPSLGDLLVVETGMIESTVVSIGGVEENFYTVLENYVKGKVSFD